MSRLPDVDLNDRWILSHRKAKHAVSVREPWAAIIEEERTAWGTIENVATLFLVNKECPFHCLMCDLWKNTLDEPTPRGAIPEQIRKGLETLPSAKHIKLYNSGNFFDTKAIPPEDYAEIAALLEPCKTVIVECHPNLINDRCLQFSDMLHGKLEIAIGLETAHPEILQKLNKRMTLDDFRDRVQFLSQHGISTRAFVLLRPPFQTEEEGVEWAKRTLDFAFESGVECCAVIPTRAGNGAMERLAAEGYFSPPTLTSLEEVVEYGIQLDQGRVFADLWDLELFSDCPLCFEDRKARLHRMNLEQRCPPHVICEHLNRQ